MRLLVTVGSVDGDSNTPESWFSFCLRLVDGVFKILIMNRRTTPCLSIFHGGSGNGKRIDPIEIALPSLEDAIDTGNHIPDIRDVFEQRDIREDRLAGGQVQRVKLCVRDLDWFRADQGVGLFRVHTCNLLLEGSGLD